ncbi:MAG: FG-GAP repeat domain-containing protein [Anaerolineae bacterium]
MATLPTYRPQTIFQGDPSERVLCLTGDLNGDGVPEIVIGARLPRAEIYWLNRIQNGEWQPHLLDNSLYTLEAGGVLADIDHDGDLDLIAGEDWSGNGLFWWECSRYPTLAWQRRLIFRMPGNGSHDQLVADLDGDGNDELYFWNQGAETLFAVPVPADPRVSPWPGVQAVAVGVREEGLAAADVDGDGKLELIAGQSWYRRSNGTWERHEFTQGYQSPRIVVADFDGDGRPEIVLAEGDASLKSKQYGRLVRFTVGDDPRRPWRAEVLHERLLDPHSLQVADFDGDGHPDLFVGEEGMPDGNDPHPPAQRIYLSRGSSLEEHVIAEIPSHEAKVIELDGRLGLVMKPYRNLRSQYRRGPEIDAIQLLLPE